LLSPLEEGQGYEAPAYRLTMTTLYQNRKLDAGSLSFKVRNTSFDTSFDNDNPLEIFFYAIIF